MTYRERIAERLENLPWMAPPIREPRGVVTVAGGPLYFALWWHLVYALRDLGCRLPLELWTVRADELDAGMYAAARDLGATVIDAQAHAKATATSCRQAAGSARRTPCVTADSPR
jgi:hypothetical protein